MNKYLSTLEFETRYKGCVFRLASCNQNTNLGFRFELTFNHVIGSSIPNYLAFNDDNGNRIVFREVGNIRVEECDGGIKATIYTVSADGMDFVMTIDKLSL